MIATHDLLIVIPCLNEAATLEELIDQFLAQAPEATIVVADGGSGDGSRDIVTRIAANCGRVHLLDNPRRIQSAGINRAVAIFCDAANPPQWLLRVDAHAGYPANYVQTLLNAARRHDATCVVVPMVSRGQSGFQIAAATAQNSVLGTGGSPHRHVGSGRFVDHGHHALMRIDLFRQVGGYREDMSHNEDAELDLRLIGAGGRIWLEPDAAIIYFPRASAAALWRQYLGYGRGRAITLRRHRQRPKLRQMLPLAPLGALLIAPLGWWCALFAVPLLAWLALCLLAGTVIGLRSNGSGSRGWAMLSGIPAGVSHLAWALGFIRGLLTPLSPPL